MSSKRTREDPLAVEVEGGIRELDAEDPFTLLDEMVESGEDDVSEDDSELGSLVSDSETESDVNLAELSDSEDEEEAPLLRIGNVPREWYADLEHFGYGVDGKAVIKSNDQGGDAIDSFLRAKDPDAWRMVYDDLQDRQVKLSTEQLAMIDRIRKNQFPHSEFNAHEEYYVKASKQIHPFGNVSNPAKSKFVPSKWENQKVLKVIQAIRNGWIRPKEDKESRKVIKSYLMWREDGTSLEEIAKRRRAPLHIPAPKEKAPGHAESYNPSPEYLPTEEEITAWEEMDPEERPFNFTPEAFAALRSVPLYDRYCHERFQRCLDLYLCPRKIKNRLDIDPESLIPELPNPSTLRPFPTNHVVTYTGHVGHVRTLSPSPCGEFLASGGEDGTVRVWEVDTGRCLSITEFPSPVKSLSWNPKLPLLAAAVDDYAVIIRTGTERPEELEYVNSLVADGEEKRGGVEWIAKDQRVSVHIGGVISSVSWHPKGDYFVTSKDSSSVKSSVMIHRLSKRMSQCPFANGKAVEAVKFHPSKPLLYVCGKTSVKVVDLAKQTVEQKIVTPAKWISSVAIHPTGDHLIVGSFDRRVCWFDLDMVSKPFKTLKYHSRGVRSVDFHPRYPLFLTGSDDGSVQVFHGRVFNDLSKDPLLVPVKILKAHTPIDDLGVLAACFHPHSPWVFSAGTDGLIKLFT